MKIYLDYVFFLNFCFDFILLLGIKLILKRATTKKRIILGSIFGGLSSFIVFLRVDEMTFFTLKMLSGIIMVLITFRFNDIKTLFYNFLYLMILSVLLGGSLYLINIEVGYNHVGMLFFENGKSLNIFILLLISIFLILIYKKSERKKDKISKNNYVVTLKIENKELILNGFLDTGNALKDPYFKKPICIINEGLIKNLTPYIYIPYETIGDSGIMKCYKIPEVKIENIGTLTNILVAESPNKIKLSGVDIILNETLWEEK